MYEEKKAELAAIYKDLSQRLNGGDLRHIVDVWSDELIKDHPTLQQLFVKMVARTLDKYAEKVAWVDGRNKDAVDFAKNIPRNNLPLI